MSACHLAFDIGTSGTKAALLTPEGQPLKVAYASFNTRHRAGGVVEQRAEDWMRAVLESCRELGDLSEVETVVMTGQMQNLTLVNAAMVSLRPTILYSDTRAQVQATALEQQLGQAALQSLTGNSQDAGSLLAKLLWLKQVEPQVYSLAKAIFLGAADFSVAHLTGAYLSDTTTASSTGLMELATRQPLPEAVFRELGLEQVPALLPKFVPGGTCAGPLTPAAAITLGLQAGIPVYLGPGDAGATTIGAGCGAPGRAYGYIGTSGWIGFSARGPADPAFGAFTLAHPDPDMFFQVAPLLTAGGNLRWIRDLFAPHGASPTESFDEVTRQALQQEPGPLLFLPYLGGERSPFRDSLARGAFVGLSSHTAKADLYRAVLEGVTFGYRHALEALLPRSPEALTLVGGGSRSAPWNALFATITGVPVEVLAEPDTIGLSGAHHSVRLRSYEKNTCPVAKVGERFEPDVQLKSHYDKMFALYLGLYPSLRETFHGFKQQ